MRNIFVKEEVNTARQIEFDIAKVLCIILMIFIHCFEQFGCFSDCTSHPLYYAIVIVMDALFCASVFVGSMGLGMAYSKAQNPEDIMRRGVRLFIAGYALNILRSTIDVVFSSFGITSWNDTLIYIFESDILQFAGLSFILFGFLKKIKCSDLMVFIIALGMSAVGSFVRFIDLGNVHINQLVGLFIGTFDPVLEEETACFPLFNWFILVVICYLYAKKLRHCNNKDRYYSMTLLLSGAIVGAYMLYAIPNRYGMLSNTLLYFYNFSTYNVLILFSGIIFLTSVYHFVLKLISERLINKIFLTSSNLTPIYFVQWIIIGNMYSIFEYLELESIHLSTIIFIAVCVIVISVFFGNRCPKSIKKIFS